MAIVDGSRAAARFSTTRYSSPAARPSAVRTSSDSRRSFQRINRAAGSSQSGTLNAPSDRRWRRRRRAT